MGYDQAQYFLRGMKRYGRGFVGSKEQNSYTALQNPLIFKQVGAAGMQNDFLQLIHFVPGGGIESIVY